MTLPHAKPGKAIDLMTLSDEIPRDKTFALVKTSEMEVIRMVLPAGKSIPAHKVTGQITVQCLRGKVVFTTNELEQMLEAGHWLYLQGEQNHSLEALEHSVLLVTIMLVNLKTT